MQRAPAQASHDTVVQARRCMHAAAAASRGRRLTQRRSDLQRKLRSESLRKDAITSGAVAALSAAIVVSTAMYSVHPQLWWFDSIVALLISLVLFTAGLWPLLSTKWWTASFWAPLAELVACLLTRPEERVCTEV